MHSSSETCAPAASRWYSHDKATATRPVRRVSKSVIVERGAILAATLLLAPHPAHADPVTDWNKIMEDTVITTNPFMHGRAAAITQLAVFDAVNSIVGDYEPYLGRIPAPAGASPEAAAIAAAHHVLVALFPAHAPSLDAHRANSLAALLDGSAKNHGIAVGLAAADALFASRADDGASGIVSYTPGSRPGDWQPTPPAFAATVFPHWGQVATFGLRSGAHFRPAPPPALRSARYTRDYHEVQEVGGVNSSERPPDRTDVARYYAAVLAVDSYNPAARQASVAQGKSLAENARIFALLNMAIHDSLVSSMEAKFHYNFWRPVTAIRAGDTDGNRRTEPDASFQPSITTPAFPSYPSNHGIMAAGARVVLEHFFGADGHDITLSSPKVPGIVLHYTAWEQIADDVDDARIFGGIHFRFDQEAGARQGRRVGEYLLRHELRPLRDRDWTIPRRK